MPSHLIAPHIQAFFAEYLCQQRRLSPQTIRSCRDTFRLWLMFLRDHTGVEPSALQITEVDAPVVLRFLTSPIELLGSQRVDSVRVVRNRLEREVHGRHVEMRGSARFRLSSRSGNLERAKG